MRKVKVIESSPDDICLTKGTIYKIKGEYFMLFEVDDDWILGCLNDGDTWSGLVSADEMLEDIEKQKFKVIINKIEIGIVK